MKRIIPLALALSVVGIAPVMAENMTTHRSTTAGRSDCSTLRDATARLNCEQLNARNEGYNPNNTSVTPSAGAAGISSGSPTGAMSSGSSMGQPGTAGTGSATTGPSAKSNPGLAGDGGSGGAGK
jgi:hypothetical protein